MLNVSNINYKSPLIQMKNKNIANDNVFVKNNTKNNTISKYTSENLQSYIPHFSAKIKDIDSIPSEKKQIKEIKSKLDNESLKLFKNLEKTGILNDNSSNDGSTVLSNLYKITTRPRIQGLSDQLILKETLKALNNPFSITQKFGDIPQNVANEIEKATGEPLPQEAYNVISSSCVATSMEFNLASKKPAEFVRFVEGLSSNDYCVTKKIDLSEFADGPAAGLWLLRNFNTDTNISKSGKKLDVKIQPDRNAIIRARVQSSYKDPGERSCIDVLIQSAILNLCSQHTYNSLNDERTGEFNSDNHGLTDFEKTFGEQIIFETPKISVIYQNLDENGKLKGYNCQLNEIKQHILKSLELNQNVIIGYTHFDSENKVDGGHEITIIGYETDKEGNGIFICNDTDDDINSAIKIKEKDLLPLIHHAGISKEALSSEDTVIESWREIVETFQAELKQDK